MLLLNCCNNLDCMTVTKSLISLTVMTFSKVLWPAGHFFHEQHRKVWKMAKWRTLRKLLPSNSSHEASFTSHNILPLLLHWTAHAINVIRFNTKIHSTTLFIILFSTVIFSILTFTSLFILQHLTARWRHLVSSGFLVRPCQAWRKKNRY
jgi:hypothetical protein